MTNGDSNPYHVDDDALEHIKALVADQEPNMEAIIAAVRTYDSNDEEQQDVQQEAA